MQKHHRLSVISDILMTVWIPIIVSLMSYQDNHKLHYQMLPLFKSI